MCKGSLLITICVLTLLSHSAFSQEYSYQDFDHYQRQFSREQIAHKIHTYLQKSPELKKHYSLTSDKFCIYASQEDKVQEHPEYTLMLSQPSSTLAREGVSLASGDLKLSWQGLQVAIDPGHVGGKLVSRIEGRYVDMKDNKGGEKKDIRFHEGKLAVATALYLKKWLQAKGANVLLTKDKPGEAVYRKDFFTWLREDFLQAVEEEVASISDPKKRAAKRSWWLTRADLSTIFRHFYNPLDLLARAQKINRFRPDLTLIIHYNAGGKTDKHGQHLGTKANYNMAFVPGSFLRGELSERRSRYEFLRLILTSDIADSLALSRLVVEEFEKHLQVPAIEETSPRSYIQQFCMPTTAKGVYARNLVLTRLVHGPICYGESLYQDNYQESRKLARQDASINGLSVSSRAKQVARAYFHAIKRLCERKGEQ